MRPYRAKTKEGKWVRGWYFKAGNKHYILEEETPMGYGQIAGFECESPMEYLVDFVEVIPETVGRFVCKDRNGKDVYEEAPCLLHCFSPPKKVYPKWNQEYLRYELWENGRAVMSAIEDTYKRHIELIVEKK